MDDAEGWIRLQELFEAALDVPASARPGWLKQRVGDPDLRARLVSLVAAHESEGPFVALTGQLANLGHRSSSGTTSPTEIGAYRVESLVGEGGTATVYAGRRMGGELAPLVAIKVIRPDVDSERVRRRFLAEREIVSRLSHRGIARFVDAGFTPDGEPYLVTEYVDGRAIDAYAAEAKLDVHERIDLLLEVCDAVEAAHVMGVVHRDIKPPNILVDAEGQPRLLDFGIAKVLDNATFPGLGRNTSAGVRLLTLRYASPEQFTGGPITPASDVYQLGLLFFGLFAERLPAMAHDSTTDERVPLLSAEANGGTPARLDRVLGRALSVRPEDRYRSAGAFADAVRAALDEERAAYDGVFGGIRAWLSRVRRG